MLVPERHRRHLPCTRQGPFRKKLRRPPAYGPITPNFTSSTYKLKVQHGWMLFGVRGLLCAACALSVAAAVGIGEL